MPRLDGRPDWESPQSWDAAAAVDAIVTLCTTGQATVPVYSIGADRRVGGTRLELDGAPLFVAEGIFAAEIVAECARLDVLAAAFAVRRHRAVTFVRRLTRDLAERRKPPALLVRRGLTLYANEPRVLARQAALGALPAGRRAIERAVAALLTAPVEAVQR
ncbi:MAG TPA: ATP-binding protein [Micromonosporaceae bacterium]